jgi:protein phosphatase
MFGEGFYMKAMLFSFPGVLRPNNEDALLGTTVYSRMNMAEPITEDFLITPALLAVADGVGGNKGGTEAAECLLKTLQDDLSKSNFQIDEVQSLVDASLELATRRLVALAAEKPALRGLGATVAGIWITEEQAVIFNAGDCRVYRIRYGYLDQLSQDHSLVFKLYSNGEITEDEMSTHPMKHIITSSIDDSGAFDSFFRPLPIIKDGDIFFLCSDGVWEVLSRDEIENCFAENEAETAANNLTNLLLNSECQDNASFIILQV